MTEVAVVLKTELDAVGMTRIVSKYPYDVDMVLGSYEIDAKSILGVIGYGMGKKTTLRINTEQADSLVEELHPYMCGVS